MELDITLKMEQVIKKKETQVKHLNHLCNQLVAMEIKEANKRVAIMNKIEAEAEKKMTDKTKTAMCDAELKQEMGQIKHLKNDIGNLKRNISLSDDKISLYRNMIKELTL